MNTSVLVSPKVNQHSDSLDKFQSVTPGMQSPDVHGGGQITYQTNNQLLAKAFTQSAVSRV